MEGKQQGLDQWLDTAVGGIRFKPDRQAVREELAAHLEDKTADFRRIFPDISPEEAEARALGEMGDAAEIGKELARFHKPWLGYLWRASQLCMAAAVIWLAALIIGGGDLGFRQEGSVFSQETGGVGGFLAQSVFDTEEVASVPLPRQQPVRQSGYTFTVEEGDLWTPVTEVGDKVSVAYEGAVHLMLRVEWLRPGEPPVYDLASWIWAEDDLDNRYLSLGEYYHSPREDGGEAPQVLLVRLRARTPLSAAYEILVPLCSGEAETLELSYTRWGADVSIPVVLRGEGEG